MFLPSQRTSRLSSKQYAELSLIHSSMSGHHVRQPLLKDSNFVDEDGLLENYHNHREAGRGSDKDKASSIHIDVQQSSIQRDSNEPRFPKERVKSVLAFVFLNICAFCATFTLSLVHEKLPPRTTDPLPDAFLDNLTTSDKYLYYTETIMLVDIAIILLIFAFNRHRYIFFRRSCLILGLLYLMRCVTMYVTVLPMSSTTYYCSPKSNSTDFFDITKRALQLMSGLGMTINGRQTYCGDFIYSGHTACLVLAALVASECTSKRLYIFHWIMWCATGAGVFFLLISRGHYTVDVVIAYYVTTRLWWNYHILANNRDLLARSSTTYFVKKEYWYPLFVFFDGKVDGPVPVQFEPPIPIPRKVINFLSCKQRKQQDWNS